jgi:hypothetical protein
MALPRPTKKYPIDMRKYLIIMLTLVVFASCKKDAGTASAPTRWMIGRWELRSMSGGFEGTILPSGNGNIYQFYGNNTYKKYTASQLTAQGSFRVASLSEQDFYMIYFDKDSTGTQLSYQNGMLTLGTSVADGPSWTYQKISN